MTRRENPFEHPAFQLKVISLLISKPHVLESYRDFIDKQFFKAEDYRQSADLILTYFDDYGEPPPLDDLSRLLPQNEQTKPYHPEGWDGVVQEIETAIKEENLQAIEDSLGDFIKYQVVGAALAASAEHREDRDWEVLQKQVLEMVEKVNSLDEGLFTPFCGNGRKKVSPLPLGSRPFYVKYVKYVTPELQEPALQGIAGEIVRAIEPFTESHPAALLGHILVFFSNIIGNGPHWMAEATRHALNLFLVLVGDTSRGRKGTAEGHVRRMFEFLDEDWVKKNIITGLSTGEGLIFRVKDKEEDEGKRKDKRLLAIEPEFSQILKVLGREGNTLSPNLRKAWDDGNLATHTRHEPLTATDVHFSFIGHISKDELLRRLKQEDARSGFGNRILFIHTHRTKLLPSGGDLKKLNKALKPLKIELLKIYHWARIQRKRITRDEKAEELWESLYPILTKDYPGVFGAITARAEAQTMRLASIYCLLDRSLTITPEHLQAAYSLWMYCEDSCRLIFGDSLGDPTADTILQASKEKLEEGLTTTDIHRLFKGNKRAAELTPVIQQLVSCDLMVEVPEKTTGRTKIRFFYNDPSSKVKYLTNFTQKGNEVPSVIKNIPTQTNGNKQLTSITKPNNKKKTKFVVKNKKGKKGLDEKVLERFKQNIKPAPWEN